MPELPETETIARDLDAAIRGATVRQVTVRRADVLRGVTGHRLATRLAGQRIDRVTRRAKSIVLALGEYRLVVTPRFTGTLLLGGPDDDDPYTCARLDLADGRVLRYRDIRRLGTLALLDGASYDGWDRSLGPEPLDPSFTHERFRQIIRGSQRPVKSILMDQSRLAGIGNIYANEACWHARVRPARRGGTLTRQECATLLDALRAILADSIALRGTTFRDFRDAYGARGGYAVRLRAYGRDGEPCARCRTPIRVTRTIDRRATYWCPGAGCQR